MRHKTSAARAGLWADLALYFEERRNQLLAKLASFQSIFGEVEKPTYVVQFDGEQESTALSVRSSPAIPLQQSEPQETRLIFTETPMSDVVALGLDVSTLHEGVAEMYQIYAQLLLVADRAAFSRTMKIYWAYRAKQEEENPVEKTIEDLVTICREARGNVLTHLAAPFVGLEVVISSNVSALWLGKLLAVTPDGGVILDTGAIRGWRWAGCASASGLADLGPESGEFSAPSVGPVALKGVDEVLVARPAAAAKWRVIAEKQPVAGPTEEEKAQFAAEQ